MLQNPAGVRMKRRCRVGGEMIATARCPVHQSTSLRGYGAVHQRARAKLAATLPAYCAYGCGTWLTPDRPWVAAHVVDGDASRGWMVACPGCNEHAKGGGARDLRPGPR